MKRTARQQPRFSYGKMFREEFETPELLRRKLHDAREKLCDTKTSRIRNTAS